MITFIGIIGKRDKPLYLRTYETEASSEARLIELAYASCDAFQERLNRGLKTTDFYFGRLLAFQKIVLYGAMSNTRIKFIVAVQETTAVISESRMRQVLVSIHAEYTKAGTAPLLFVFGYGSLMELVLNPFHLARVDDNEPISSPAMDRAINQIVSSWAGS